VNSGDSCANDVAVALADQVLDNGLAEVVFNFPNWGSWMTPLAASRSMLCFTLSWRESTSSPISRLVIVATPEVVQKRPYLDII
jgi:hypothetical protein